MKTNHQRKLKPGESDLRDPVTVTGTCWMLNSYSQEMLKVLGDLTLIKQAPRL